MEDRLDAPQLGTFLGVFVPCTATIFGVVVFLRLGFVVGQAGVWATLAIIIGCFVLCLLTTTSLCALISDGNDGYQDEREVPAHADGLPRRRLSGRRNSVSLINGQMPLMSSPQALGALRRQASKDPGVYCALRKSVGAEFGAMIGAAFYLAYVVDVAWYIVGFAENLQDAIGAQSRIQVFPWNPPGTYVTTAIASGSLAILSLITTRSVHLTARLSLAVLVVIMMCITASLLCLLSPTYDPESGPTSPSIATLLNNSAPQLTAFNNYDHPTFTLMFVLVFPGFTGVLAGSNLSGHLLAPTCSIAQGTFASLSFVVITYSAICLTLAATVERPYLKSNLRIMDTVVFHSVHLPLGQIGVACTTLSSALSYLLGAPRVLQAVSRDAGWRWLSTPGYEDGERQEPIRALILTWLIVQLILLTGSVNLLAPLVSGVFLLVFCILNLLAFIASLATKRFAPHFRFHSRWLSLAGFLSAFMSMAWALSETPTVGLGLGILFALLLLWQRRPLHQLFSHGFHTFSSPAVETGPALELVEADDSAATAERIERAAVCIQDGLRGHFAGRALLSRPLEKIKSKLTLRTWRLLRHANMFVYCALAFVERPVWCYGMSMCGDGRDGGIGDLGSEAPGLGIDFLPLWASQSIEAVCVMVFAWEMNHKVSAMSRAGIIVSTVSASTMTFFNPLLRPILFATMSSRTRRAIGTCIRVLPSLAPWAALLLLLLSFYMVLGVLCFGQTSPLLAPDEKYFTSIQQALISLVVCLTTANFPDVMLPAYNVTGARIGTFSFFSSFLLIGLFFLMSMFLFEIVHAYKALLALEEASADAQRKEALSFAFELLDFNANGIIAAQDFAALLRRLQRPVPSTLALLEPCALSREMLGIDPAAAGRSLSMLTAETASSLPATGVGPERFHELLIAIKDGHDVVGNAASPGQLSTPRTHQHSSCAARDLTIGIVHENAAEDGGSCGSGAACLDEIGTATQGATSPMLTAMPASQRSPAVSTSSTRAEHFADAPMPSHNLASIQPYPHTGTAEMPVPGRCKLRSCQRWTSSPFLQWGRATLLLCDATLLGVEVEMTTDYANEKSVLRIINASAPVFIAFFVLELAYTLRAIGTRRYVRDVAHMFDGSVTVVTVSADLYALLGNPSAQSLRLALAVRAVRMLRLVSTISRLRGIFYRFVKMLPRLTGLFGAMWTLFCIYAQLGVLLFGGTIYHGDRYEKQAAKTDDDVLYTYCNFNDFGSAIVTLFELLVVNNWQVITHAVVTVDGDWSRIYFLTWWVLAVLVFSNLLVAFILEEMVPKSNINHDIPSYSYADEAKQQRCGTTLEGICQGSSSSNHDQLSKQNCGERSDEVPPHNPPIASDPILNTEVATLGSLAHERAQDSSRESAEIEASHN